MSDLESIIRPFQSGEVSTARVFFTAAQARANISMQIGRGGSGKTMNGSMSTKESVYMTKYENEKKTADFGTSF